ncbi:Uncharacterised protein [Candidatus Gugararchaeum adminiculabundum]|nr:Uncharacterised protein [Candidatus Gugararchaeum adminiculabundum]
MPLPAESFSRPPNLPAIATPNDSNGIKFHPIIPGSITIPNSLKEHYKNPH